MRSNKQKITAILLILFVLILGGASVFIATQLNTKGPVAPNAPRSKPRASEWLGGGACNLTFTVDAPGLSCSKVVSDTSTPAKEIATIAQGKEFLYKIKVTNTGTVALGSATVTDVLTGEHQDLLSFVDSSTGCTYQSSSKTVTCTVSDLAAGTTKEAIFKVKVASNAANGQVISNKCKVKSGDLESECTANVTVGGTVACNNACTSNDQCTNGFKCITGMCRKEACSGETDCVCPTSTTTTTVRPTGTTTVTTTATATVTPANLPDTGILNLPGAAVFGGGLLLTVLGILFAL